MQLDSRKYQEVEAIPEALFVWLIELWIHVLESNFWHDFAAISWSFALGWNALIWFDRFWLAWFGMMNWVCLSDFLTEIAVALIACSVALQLPRISKPLSHFHWWSHFGAPGLGCFGFVARTKLDEASWYHWNSNLGCNWPQGWAMSHNQTKTANGVEMY